MTAARLPDQAYYLAEWYREALGPALVDDLVAQLIDATQSGASQAPVTPVHVVAVLAAPADDVVYGLFSADSAVAISTACRDAGLPVQRLTADIEFRILTLTGQPPPSSIS